MESYDVQGIAAVAVESETVAVVEKVDAGVVLAVAEDLEPAVAVEGKVVVEDEVETGRCCSS